MSSASHVNASSAYRCALILLLSALSPVQYVVGEAPLAIADSISLEGTTSQPVLEAPIPVDEPFRCFPRKNEDCYFNKYSSRVWPDVRQNLSALTKRWQRVAAEQPLYPEGRYHGWGIAILCGPRGMNNLPVVLKVLRDLGCKLPVEVWHFSSENLPFEHATWISRHQNVMLKNLHDYAKDIEVVETNVGPRMFGVKPLVLLHSSFEEVLLIDDDNLPVRNPAYLFEDQQYRESGATFWPDYWRTSTLNPIWELVGAEPHGYAQESGQLLINKRKGWVALAVALLFNQAPYRLLLNDDKDTYRFAWMAVKQPFSFVRQPVGTTGMINSKDELCGTTMLQFDLDGREIFLHHNMLRSGPLERAGSNWAKAKVPIAGQMEHFVPVPGSALVLPDETTINCMDINGRYDVILHPFKEFEEKYFDSHRKMEDLWLLTNSTERFKIPVPEDSLLSTAKGVSLHGTIWHNLSFPAPDETKLTIRLEIVVKEEGQDGVDDPSCESKLWVDQVLLPLGRCPSFGAVSAGKTFAMHNKYYHKLLAKNTGQGKCAQVFELVAQPFTGVITKKSVKVRLCGQDRRVHAVRCLNTSVKLEMPRCRGKPITEEFL